MTRPAWTWLSNLFNHLPIRWVGQFGDDGLSDRGAQTIYSASSERRQLAAQPIRSRRNMRQANPGRSQLRFGQFHLPLPELRSSIRTIEDNPMEGEFIDCDQTSSIRPNQLESLISEIHACRPDRGDVIAVPQPPSTVRAAEEARSEVGAAPRVPGLASCPSGRPKQAVGGVYIRLNALLLNAFMAAGGFYPQSALHPPAPLGRPKRDQQGGYKGGRRSALDADAAALVRSSKYCRPGTPRDRL